MQEVNIEDSRKDSILLQSIARMSQSSSQMLSEKKRTHMQRNMVHEESQLLCDTPLGLNPSQLKPSEAKSNSGQTDTKPPRAVSKLSVDMRKEVYAHKVVDAVDGGTIGMIEEPVTALFVQD